MSVRSASISQTALPARPARVRISLLPPFTSGNYLLPIPDSVGVVTDLKELLRHAVPAVRDLGLRLEEISLEIDGFEVLEGPITMLREEDIVCVKMSPSSSKGSYRELPSVGTSVKRKRRDSTRKAEGSYQLEQTSIAAPTGPAHSGSRSARKHQRGSLVNGLKVRGDGGNSSLDGTTSDSDTDSTLTTSASGSSSSSSTSSTSSVASTSSASDSPSSSSSSSASSSSPTKNGGSPDRFPVKLKPISKQENHVPPGQGNPATKLRNLRRRKKNLMQRRAAQAALGSDYRSAAFRLNGMGRGDTTGPDRGVEKRVGEQNISAEVASAAGRPEEITTSISISAAQTHVLPKDISNRNKRKGFLKMAKTGIKTVFGDIEQAAEGGRTGTVEEGPKGSPPEDVERSVQKQNALPTNLFITTAQFPWVQKGKKRSGPAESSEQDAAVRGHTAQDPASNSVMQQAPIRLAAPPASAAMDNMTPIWGQVDAGIDELPNLQPAHLQSLPIGALLAWTSVELNLTTFSPELTVLVGRLESRSDTGVRIRRLYRPDTESAEYGTSQSVAEGQMDETQEEAEFFDLTQEEIDRDPAKYKILSTRSKEDAAR